MTVKTAQISQITIGTLENDKPIECSSPTCDRLAKWRFPQAPRDGKGAKGFNACAHHLSSIAEVVLTWHS